MRTAEEIRAEMDRIVSAERDLKSEMSAIAWREDMREMIGEARDLARAGKRSQSDSVMAKRDAAIRELAEPLSKARAKLLADLQSLEFELSMAGAGTPRSIESLENEIQKLGAELDERRARIRALVRQRDMMVAARQIDEMSPAQRAALSLSVASVKPQETFGKIGGR